MLAAMIVAAIFAALYLDLKFKYEALLNQQITYPTSSLSPTEIYEKANASVVVIEKKLSISGFFKTKTKGLGIIYDRDGHIITNFHIIEGADLIQVKFSNGTILEAKLLAYDIYSDLAVLKVNASETLLKPLKFGDSDFLKVGDTVYIIGSLYGLPWTLSIGYIHTYPEKILQMEIQNGSERGNITLIDVINFHAPISLESSGGPLLDNQGRLVGIVIIKNETQQIGYAVPSKIMKKIISELIRNHEYAHAWIGIEGKDMNRTLAERIGVNFTTGFLITKVLPKSPAETSGLKSGDIIIKIDDILITDESEIIYYLEKYKRPYDTVELVVCRNGTVLDMPVFLRLGRKPFPTLGLQIFSSVNYIVDSRACPN